MKKNFLRGLSLLLALFAFAGFGALAEEATEETAEVATEVEVPATLEPGMSGAEVKDLRAHLMLLGYMSGELGEEYDEATEAAVRAFQVEAGIEESGIADGDTQLALLAEDAPMSPDSTIEGEQVWVPKSGTKYHSDWNCSGMSGPSLLSLEEAEAQGYTACSKCFSDAEEEE